MLTGDQARLFGFADRGLVRPGFAADLVLFDPDRVGTTGVRFVDDQPAGGRRLITDAQGIEMSVVNGKVAAAGRYPDRNELAGLVHLKAPAASASGEKS